MCLFGSRIELYYARFSAAPQLTIGGFSYGTNIAAVLISPLIEQKALEGLGAGVVAVQSRLGPYPECAVFGGMHRANYPVRQRAGVARLPGKIPAIPAIEAGKAIHGANPDKPVFILSNTRGKIGSQALLQGEPLKSVNPPGRLTYKRLRIFHYYRLGQYYMGLTAQKPGH